MNYADRFELVDAYLCHLDPLMAGIGDPFIQSRYLGFIATSAVTAYELAVKDIFYRFADQKHRVLGAFARGRFDRLNGRIAYRNLKEEHIKLFGDRYVDKFKNKIQSREKQLLRSGSGSAVSAYGNIIIWRHNFVHQGQIPNTTNYNEMKVNYNLGKEVLHCLSKAMCR